MLEIPLVEVIAGGPRLQFEFEQLLPGGEDPDAGDRSSRPSSCATADSPTAPERYSRG